MKKNYFKTLLQASLLLGAAFVISSCDDVIGQEDNPVASYVQWEAKTPKSIELTLGIAGKETATVKAVAVSSVVIVYESENTEIAKIDPVTGVITAVGVGETNIKAVVSGASSAGQSVFIPEEIKIPVIVKDGKVSLKAKAAEKVQTINTVDAAKTIDVSKFFDVYPETGNTITYTLLHHNNITGKKITGYAAAGAELGSITAAGVYTQGTNKKDTTVYVVAEITSKADGFFWALDAEENHINHKDTIAINIKESIAYINAKGESTILTADKYNEIDLSTNKELKADSTYYVIAATTTYYPALAAKGNVTLIFKKNVNAYFGNIDDQTDGNAALNIFGEAIPGATAGTYNAWKPSIVSDYYPNAITNFKEINLYAGQLTVYGLIKKVKDVNVFKDAKLYAYTYGSFGGLSLTGKLTINGGTVEAYNSDSDDETGFAVIGDVVLNKGSFYARNTGYRAVKGSLTAGEGLEFVESNDPADDDSWTKITGTSSNAKAVKSQDAE